MIEACWIVLILIGCSKSETRPQALILAMMGGAQYALLSLHPGMHSELGALMIQIWSAGFCAFAMPPSRPRWALMIMGLFAVSLIFQFFFWTLHMIGVDLGLIFYFVDQGVFTLQLICAAWAAGNSDARFSCRHRRRRRRMGRSRHVPGVARNPHSTHR